jgi:nucleolar pre-ribosomal-associated protein 2
MEFDQFVQLATALNELETSRKDINLALLKEFCRRTFEYIHIIPNETRNKVYIMDAFKTIKKRLKKAAEKSKHKLSYAFIAIFEVVLKVLLDAKTQIIERKDVETLVTSFKDHLIDQLKEILRKSRKGGADRGQDESLTILSTIDALSSLGAGASEISELREDVTAFAASDKSELSVGVRLKTFIFTTIYGSSTGLVNEVDVDAELAGDVKTTCGRQAIVQKAKALAFGDNEQKLKLLDSIFGPGLIGLTCADKLLAARQVIISLEGMFHRIPRSAQADDLRYRKARR